MGYNTDQFFNNKDFGLGATGGPRNNPPFTYPDRAIRAIDSEGKLTVKQLRRGYIRSLPTDGSGEGTTKCNFQFNPDKLNQSVAQMTGVLDMMHQGPEALATPLMGSSNFAFALQFDRSMELNNPSGAAFTQVDDLWAEQDPSEVGVLRDISALYTVIGQGVGASQIERSRAAQSLNQIITVESNISGGERVDDARSAHGHTANFVNRNIGNSAFLIPMPVRIVFSSLYMVDGYVSACNVLFSKFTSAYVPMQATVTLTVDAKYIGFAQKETAATFWLQDLNRATLTSPEEQRDTRNAVIESATTQLAVIGYRHVGNVLTLPVGNSDEGIVTRVSHQSMPTSLGDANPIGQAFNSGDISAVSQLFEWTLYGPFDSETSAQNATLYNPNNVYFSARILGSSAGEGYYATSAGTFAKMYGENKKPIAITRGASEPDFGDTWWKIVVKGSVYVVPTNGTDQVVGTFKHQFTKEGGDWAVEDWVYIPIEWPNRESTAPPGTSLVTEWATDLLGGVSPDNGTSPPNQTPPGSPSSVGTPQGGSAGRPRPN